MTGRRDPETDGDVRSGRDAHTSLFTAGSRVRHGIIVFVAEELFVHLGEGRAGCNDAHRGDLKEECATHALVWLAAADKLEEGAGRVQQLRVEVEILG